LFLSIPYNSQGIFSVNVRNKVILREWHNRQKIIVEITPTKKF